MYLTVDMDIVLGVFDTFIFDRFYSTILPGASLTFGGNATAPIIERDAIELDPVSEYFGWQPSQYAFGSRLDRDNDIRLLLSLFLITWYASFCPAWSQIETAR